MFIKNQFSLTVPGRLIVPMLLGGAFFLVFVDTREFRPSLHVVLDRRWELQDAVLSWNNSFKTCI